jgi:hypothetical protein
MMRPNIGRGDREVRVIIGLALLNLVFVLNGNAHWLEILGVVLLITSVFGFCPLYRLVGMSTCPLPRRE